MSFVATVNSFLAELGEILFFSGSRLQPIYLLTFVVLAFVIFRLRKTKGSFLAWAFPKATYLHPSTLVDLKVFVAGRALAGLGMLQLVAVSAFTASFISGLFGSSGLVFETLHPAAVAVLLLMTGDFVVYWVHRVHHENLILWPFHALHHSAEVMTPVTVYRKHPIYDLINAGLRGLLIGVAQGLLIGLVAGEVSMLTIAGLNAGYVIFNIAGSNLRHTHIWLSYGKVVEHILISPAQHQIHHSVALEHYNKNYGEVLAIWDWVFGTLYVPSHQERLEFGIGDAKGNRIDQPHDTLWNAMVVPFRQSARQIKRALRRKAGPRVTPAE